MAERVEREVVGVDIGDDAELPQLAMGSGFAMTPPLRDALEEVGVHLVHGAREAPHRPRPIDRDAVGRIGRARVLHTTYWIVVLQYVKELRPAAGDVARNEPYRCTTSTTKPEATSGRTSLP